MNDDVPRTTKRSWSPDTARTPKLLIARKPSCSTTPSASSNEASVRITVQQFCTHLSDALAFASNHVRHPAIATQVPGQYEASRPTQPADISQTLRRAHAGRWRVDAIGVTVPAEIHDDDRDVVAASSENRLVDESVRGTLSVCLTEERRDDLVIVEFSMEPVRTDDEPFAVLKGK